jgi:EAL domain-containing protein (putative c-di-GMP-specific phosphodiesterase class I)
MRDADTAMYQAKRAGKARHEVFDEKMFQEARDTLLIETDLRKAVERRELTVCYQPILSLESGRIEGFEALARWRHDGLGDIPPNKFIPVAEEIGVIDQLCEDVLRQGCRDIGSLGDAMPDGVPPTLSVNLSCRQFAKSSLVRSIERILEETRFSPYLLKFEITESVFVEHPARAIEMLKQLRASGIDIHIDDFGTGYSNMSYLVKLPISTLKVDRSFVKMIGSDGQNHEIVKAIVTLAHSLDLKVIAEGIETEAQRRKLVELGCEGGQGYIFAAPMDFAHLVEYLRGHGNRALPVRPFDDVSSVTVVQ